MSPSDATIYLVEDDEAVRDALGFVLRANGFRVEAFGSADEFLQRYRPDEVHCIVLDVRLPGLTGLDLQRWFSDRGEDVPIVFISGHGDVPTATQAFRGGAVDFIQKPVDAELLFAAIGRALERSRAGATQRAKRIEIEARYFTLTPREREVMQRVVAGGTNKAIAADLCISPRTVEIYRRRVMEKMQVRTLPDLVRTAEALSGEASPVARRS